LDLIESAPYVSWVYRRYGVRALVAMGKKAEAIQYAEASRGLNDNPTAIGRACEEILLYLLDVAYGERGLGIHKIIRVSILRKSLLPSLCQRDKSLPPSLFQREGGNPGVFVS
jgi:hypothetical protein